MNVNIQKDIAALRPLYRNCLIMHKRDRLSYEEIAALIEQPVSVVRDAIGNGLRQLLKAQYERGEGILVEKNKTKEERAAEIVADMAVLRHTLGISDRGRAEEWGYRNYYCAETEHASMRACNHSSV